MSGELPDIFKWINGFNKINKNMAFVINEKVSIHSNGFKLDQFRFKREIGRKWFTNNAVNEWNRLSSYAEGFKRTLDRFIDEGNMWI